mmetsp:Transcript_13459/g.28902  ORF Transcript_13459/g.28902 Transcript_13459/m.28902 type:complete len:84 (-) Transcript_13459:663-914(-)
MPNLKQIIHGKPVSTSPRFPMHSFHNNSMCGFFNLKSITPTETVQQSDSYVTCGCTSLASFMEAYITEESSATTPFPPPLSHS